MKITIITATYNSERTLCDTIESVLGQTYADIEYLIVDGASTDRTLEFARSYEPRFEGRMRIISEPDQGIYDALNKGQVVFLSDQDDVWHPEKVSVVCRALQSADLVLHNCAVVGSCDRVIVPDYFAHHPPRLSRMGLLRKSPFMRCCMAFNRKILDRVRSFLNFLVEHDAWIGIQALKHGTVFAAGDVLLNYRRYGYNVSPCSEVILNSLSVKFMRRVDLLIAFFCR